MELIVHPRMVDLVSKKWERFARRIFFRRFLITLAYLLIFLLTTILDQTRTETVVIFLFSSLIDFFSWSFRLKVKVNRKLLLKSKVQE